MKKMRTKKAGFTVIEVVLVLAVAGLIFLVVFSALPAIQVSSRDTQRREHISKLVSTLKDYQTNNRGALPSLPENGDSVSGSSISNGTLNSASDTSWAGFYRDYIGKEFRDPLGEYYNLSIMRCGAKSADADCIDKDGKVIDLSNAAFSSQSTTIFIVVGASCHGDKAVGTSSQRKVAVLYKLEGAGTYCQGT